MRDTEVKQSSTADVIGATVTWWLLDKLDGEHHRTDRRNRSFICYLRP